MSSLRPTPDTIFVLWILSVVILVGGLLAVGNADASATAGFLGGALVVAGFGGITTALAVSALRATLAQRDASAYLVDEDPA